MSPAITPVRMPKWGLSMQEGKVISWAKGANDKVAEGDDLVDIETSKITNICEAPSAGTLRRIVAQEGDTLPVGALLAVLAGPEVSDGEIDAFVTDFNARFVVDVAEGGGGGLPSREINAAGVTLRAGFVGEGQPGVPALLIHGFGGDLENWTLVMGPLAEDRPVYALDLPGHGQSQKALTDGSVAGLARTVIGAMDALGIERAHLVGHSLGGAIALAVAIAAPSRAASLSLVASAGLPGVTVSADYLDGFIQARRARDLQPVAAMLFSDKALATKELVEALVRYKRIDGVEEALQKIRNAMLETEELKALGARLAEAHAPLLVISAGRDEIVTRPGALPSSAVRLDIEDAGHLPQIERAGEVVEALRAHMAASNT